MEEKQTTTHIEHLEDGVYRQSQSSVYRTASDIIAGILSQERNEGSLSYKVDGAPSFVTGRDEKGFFIATKSGHKEDKRCYSSEDITNIFATKPAVTSKLTQLYEGLKGENWGKNMIYQGEFLFGSGDLMTHESGVIGYRPNTLIYSVPAGHPDHEQFTKAKLGVVLHTQYSNAHGQLVRIPNPQLPKITNSDVWTSKIQPAYELSDEDQTNLTQLQGAANSMDAWGGYHGTQLVSWMRLYRPEYKHTSLQKWINTQIREHEGPIRSYHQIIASYQVRLQEQVTHCWTKQIDKTQGKLTTRLAKKQTSTIVKEVEALNNQLETQKNKLSQALYAVQHNKHIITHGLQARVAIQSIKNEIIDTLNRVTKHDLPYEYYYPSEELTQSQGGEGYVYTSPNNDISKLVLRYEFSRNNFIIAKNRVSQNHKPITIAYGRFNPMTRGHQQMIMTARAEADAAGVPFIVYITRKQDKDTDPVAAELKLKLAQEALLGCDVRLVGESAPTLPGIIEQQGSQGYNHITLASGSDAAAWKQSLEQYTFEGLSFTTKTYGNTRKELGEIIDSDSSIETISATRVRKLARDDEREKFIALMPEGVSDETLREIYHAIRAPQTN